MRACGIAIAAISLLWSAAVADTIETFKIGNWSGAAFSAKNSSQFSHCAVSVPYRNGITMLFTVNSRYEWSIGFGDPSWQLNVGGKYPLIFTIDNNAPGSAEAKVISRDLVEIPLAARKDLFERFKKGYRLRVDAAGQTFQFNLDGSSKALDATLQCAYRYATGSANPGNNNPFVPRPPKANGSPTSASRAEATALLSNVLSSSGITGYFLVPPDKMTDILASYDAAWGTGKVAGTLKIVTRDARFELGSAPAFLIAADATTCKGKFASGSDGGGKDRPTRAFTACDNGGQSWAFFYSILERPSGGLYVFACMADGNTLEARRRPAEESAARISEAAFRIVSR